jgi:mono/diheme cytochrome c family protein
MVKWAAFQAPSRASRLPDLTGKKNFPGEEGLFLWHNRGFSATEGNAMKPIHFVAMLLTLGLAAAPAARAAETQSAKSAAAKADKNQIERGRYLLTLGNCNDCHTAGFAPSDGRVPEKDWLLGDGSIGFSGPWGTTYATNLRLSLSRMSEAEWVQYAMALRTRPPMPWFNLNQWTSDDLRAFYQYVRHLGPAGQAAPQALPPGQAPKTPFINWPAPPKGRLSPN